MKSVKKCFGFEAGGIAGSQDRSAPFQEGQGGGQQNAIILRGPENAVFFGVGKSRRVQNDEVKQPLLFGQPAQPIEGVPKDEVVLRRLQLVERKIVPAPVEIFFGKVEAGDMRAGQCCANRKTAGVSKRVEDFCPAGGGGGPPGQKAAAIVALVEEKTDRITFVEAQSELRAILAHQNSGRGWRAAEPSRRVLGLALQELVINAVRGYVAGARFDPSPLRGRQRAFGLGEHEITQPIKIQSGPAVRAAVNKAIGVGLGSVNNGVAQGDAGVLREPRWNIEGYW